MRWGRLVGDLAPSSCSMSWAEFGERDRVPTLVPPRGEERSEPTLSAESGADLCARRRERDDESEIRRECEGGEHLGGEHLGGEHLGVETM